MTSNLEALENSPPLTEAESVELCGAMIDYWHATDPDAYFILHFMRPIGPEIRKYDCKYWPQLFESHYKAIKSVVDALSEGPTMPKKTN